MKNKFFNRLFLLSTALITMSVNVWSEEETYTFASFESADDVTIETPTNFTIVMHKNTAGTAPAWVESSSEARVYAAGSLVISSDKTITKIVYTYTVNANKKGTVPTIDGVSGSGEAGTWNSETQTWTGSSNEVTFATSGSAGNVGFTEVKVTFESAAPTVHYTVTLLNNGQPVNKGGFDENGQKDYVSGATLGELPTLTSAEACDASSNHFMGWYAGDPIREKQQDPPTCVTSSTTVNGDMTLRAVWAREQ